MKRVLFALITSAAVSSAAFSGTPTHTSDTVDWKLFFNQMFALELHKDLPNERDYQAALKKFTAYTPLSFNESLSDVLEANTSAQVYARREAIFDNKNNYQKIAKLNFTQSVPEAVRALPAVTSYLKSIEALAARPIAPTENFFESKEANNFLTAMSFAKNGKQEVAMVMVPGYAAHTIKFEIFPEIMQDINTYWGRPAARPYTETNTFEVRYEGYKDFYSRYAQRHKDFDIVHPAGWEMGNTVGLNAETSDLMADWIRNLPSEYRNKKLILLGYSKGAGVILEMLQRHPDLKSRVIGVVTYAGVIQGTHVARFGRKEIEGFLGNRTIDDLIKKIRSRGTPESIQDIAPFLASFDMSFLKISEIKKILDVYGIDTKTLEANADRILEGRELKELLDGVIDLAPDTRTAWNLKNFDNNLVEPKTFFFNISALTDISAWATRMAGNNVQQRPLSLLTPALKPDDAIDWTNFSLDAWFLYISSLTGFTLAPGGLYDAQVDLQHTKTPWLDQSPLSASLTQDELVKLWEVPEIRSKMSNNGILSFESFTTSPRSKLIRPENRSNICAYDLGEIKAHHWSLFHQAFRAPADVSTQYAVWDFPRKAFMRAMLQTLALYNLVSQSTVN